MKCTLFSLCCVLTAVLVTGDKVRWPKVVLMGDALTEMSFGTDNSWGSLLYDRLIGKADVMNRGASGYTTAEYLTYLSEAMSNLNPQAIAAVTVLLGRNEAFHRSPVTEFSSSFSILLTRLVNDYKISSEKIIVITVPSVDVKRVGDYDLESVANEAVRIGTQANVTTLNIFEIFSQDPRKGDLYYDGVDFSVKGSNLLIEHLWPLIQLKVDMYIDDLF